MKRMITLLLAAVLCLSAAACSQESVPKETSQEIHIKVTNTVEAHVTALGATWYIGNSPFGNTGMNAADGKEIGSNAVEFVLQQDDLPKDADLTQFGVKFSAEEVRGVAFDVCTLHFPVEFGKEYTFELRVEDGCYAIWSEADHALFTGSPIPAEESAGSMDLAGPWHLDSENNDLAAFTDRFPGYAEWGASMEIRSNGLMSWYIGVEGWHGSYVIDDETLHAELRSDLEQIVLPWDFRIVTENEMTMLEMDYEDVTVFWIYGDQEDIPAAGNDFN